MTKTMFAVALFLASGPAVSLDRYVRPPAPKIVDGTPVRVEQEVSGNSRIIHIERPATSERKYVGDYLVEIYRDDQQRFSADLSTRMYGKDEEVLFLTIPAGSESTYTITVISRAAYPYSRVFTGTISSIPLIGK